MTFRFGSKPVLISTAMGMAALGVAGYILKEEHRSAILEIYVFNLQSGRSIFVRTPEDKRILIDGGSGSAIVSELTKILPFYSRRVDILIATNDEAKNIAGLIEVLDRYSVNGVYTPAVTSASLGFASSTSSEFEIFRTTVRDRNIPIQEIAKGNTLALSSSISMDALFPVQKEKFSYSKASPPELLFKISYGNTSIIFLGNASSKIQKFIASSTSPADVLIVSHGALPANMAKQLLAAIGPNTLIYSKTINKNTHSTSQSIATNTTIVKSFNLREKGSLKIVSDGIHLQINPD